MSVRLQPATDAHLAWLLDEGEAPDDFGLPDGGVAPPDVLEIVRGMTAALHRAGCGASWLILDGSLLVGLTSFKEPPDATGSAEIGYGIAPACQRQGYARAAVSQLIEEVISRGLATSLRADTSVDNIASQAVLERNGFARTGTRYDDEDGDLICWSRALG
ncbi:GNAT family N-acetyltransferase [Sphingobium nicotianae]|uniref:GNAT family N-acetyltransferase n=1 Tax=Sphingobium nicotianae TaxID=2782607 RepID=A0A9X1DBB3_9SPHN|nr:GNAT family N-acetyltransferase [Sphingobium nicotianae]MBT2186887.1 GNAT family N-acetyltransferase [Sphingobium nicotianae]